MKLDVLSITVAFLASPTVFASSNKYATSLEGTSQQETLNTYIVIFERHVTPEIADSHQKWVEKAVLIQNVWENRERSAAQIPIKLDRPQALSLKHTYDIA